MRLRSKFFLITAAATMVPIVGATLAGRTVVRRNSQARFALLFSDGEKEVRRKYRALSQRVQDSVQRLANPEDNYIGPILIALAKGDGADDVLRQSPRRVGRVMRERGLDLLTVLDQRGRILAAGHYPGRAGERRPLPAHSAGKERPRLAVVRVMAQGRPQDRLALTVWRQVRSPLGTRVWVRGGRFMDQRFTRGLRFSATTMVQLADGAGRVLVAPAGSAASFARYPQRRVILGDDNPTSSAHVTLAVSNEALTTTLEVINYAAAAFLLGAFLLALLVGTLTRPVTRPLERLVEAAEAVAAGDLDHRIPKGGADEVGELVASFNRMVGQLEESKAQLVAAERVAAWREIARRIAHEIKNPLSPIQTSIENLRKAYDKKHPELDEIFDEATQTILEEVTRMKRIVSEFSGFARMPKPEPRPFAVQDWLVSTLRLYGADTAQLVSQLPHDLEITADREQLTQVLSNLLHNAIDAVAAQGSPSVVLHASIPDEATLMLEVVDNGPGFDRETAQRVFTPYFTTKGSGGTGLGLAVCHRIVSDHRGVIEARGEPGVGARFVVRLPLLAG